MQELRNQVICGDSIEVLRTVQEPFADLVFADPPFNIGYKYDKYHDRKKSEKYLAWTRDWIEQCVRVLKPHGSFYIAIGDEYAAQIKLIGEQEFGLTLRNWIIWHYTFGQQTKTKFARSHTHIFYFVKDPKNFVFNDGIVRVISDRQKKYADKRANPDGKMPDDVWNEYPRICGTFRERTGHPCQMPESLLARIIRASSNEGDWVLDPFCGSGTTATVAHKLNRVYTTIDLSEVYVEATRQRIADCGLSIADSQRDPLPILNLQSTIRNQERVDDEIRWLYGENKVPVRQLCGDPMLLALFTRKLEERLGKGPTYATAEVKARLLELERTAKLSPLARVSGTQMEAAGLFADDD